MTASVLIVDDERGIRESLTGLLEDEGFAVESASTGEACLLCLEQRPFDCVLLDVCLGDGIDGLETLARVKVTWPHTPVLMISGHGTIETAVEAIKKGAYDYISKPPDLNRLLITIKNALDKSKLLTETKALRKVVSKQFEMIGQSARMNEIRSMIEKVAPTQARVLITGENGTGKELVARQLHELGNRSFAPFIEVNCAAIPSELIESQLFGHEKGSFTSAIKQRKGDFELAHGGTLFLDEIGDMSLSAQAKVLRALQENKITRVGGEKEIPVDVRILAATNKNLKEEIEKGRFREDLYHRISVIVIEVPPLRDRKEDIPLLVSHFMTQICQNMGKAVPAITDEAMHEMQQYRWTGNIRELHNATERLVILGGNTIEKVDVQRYARPLND